ncbi:metallophosphoesterase [Candidatus Woesearchaeota archaeon]|nr:metallophosphoesterase [Candidatus Woesearchaeota archaeon]
MRFAHLSDCHLGSWKHPALRSLNLQSFQTAIEKSVALDVDFILISGDLFDTALPSLDTLKEATTILKGLHMKNIPVYVIPGSHDYAPSGKTILDVFAEAGFVTNVMRFHDDKLQILSDPKTGIKITGMNGKKGGLESFTYSTLQKDHLEQEPGLKIFLFHSLIHELKPTSFQHADGISLEDLPKGFHYYAGGHPHMIYSAPFGNGIVAYPGPIFPNNFQELETLQHGSFYIVEFTDGKFLPKSISLPLVHVSSYSFSAEGKTSQDVEREILSTIVNWKGKILLLRIHGCLCQGKPSDLSFLKLQRYFQDAFVFLRNTAQLTSKEYLLSDSVSGLVQAEDELVQAFLQPFLFPQEYTLTQSLIHLLDQEKKEGERNLDFDQRLLREAATALSLPL